MEKWNSEESKHISKGVINSFYPTCSFLTFKSAVLKIKSSSHKNESFDKDEVVFRNALILKLFLSIFKRVNRHKFFLKRRCEESHRSNS